MAGVAKVTFENGEVVEVEMRPALLVQAERHFKGTVPPIEGTLWACWKKLKSGLPFDQWLDTVDSIDESEGEGDSSPLDQEASPAA